MIKKEACVESYEEALKAQRLGAHQIELCSNLAQDGLTPFRKDIVNCMEHLDIHVKTMIRPFSGPFILKDDEELKVVRKQINDIKLLGVEEVVFGFVTPRKELDIILISRLRDLAYPMDVTIHKAIDSCKDPLLEVQKMVSLGGIKSILTSGGAPTALKGVDVLRDMIDISEDQLDIISAGKITDDNLMVLHGLIQGQSYHGRKIVGDLS